MLIAHKLGWYWTGTGWGMKHEALRYQSVVALPTHIIGLDGTTELERSFRGDADPLATYSASSSDLAEAWTVRANGALHAN